MSYFSYQKGDRWWVRATVITVAVINYSFTGYLICKWRRLGSSQTHHLRLRCMLYMSLM
jgi:hypothetical protein